MVLPDLVPICREQHFRRRFIPVIGAAFISTNKRGESAGDNHRVGVLFRCSSDYRYGPCLTRSSNGTLCLTDQKMQGTRSKTLLRTIRRGVPGKHSRNTRAKRLGSRIQGTHSEQKAGQPLLVLQVRSTLRAVLQVGGKVFELPATELIGQKPENIITILIAVVHSLAFLFLGWAWVAICQIRRIRQWGLHSF
jgi:hypothetical protein